MHKNLIVGIGISKRICW